tara:strand:- start:83 stop:430 length:348 start_codon:yes stop_codon:yes gene_type:complete
MKLLTVLSSFLILVGCEDSKVKKWDVMYKVKGSGSSFDVTMSNQDGGTSQLDNVNSGWSYSFRTEDERHFLYISAQNQSNTGSVTTEIYIDGSLMKSSTSDGAYVIASCSMSVSD